MIFGRRNTDDLEFNLGDNIISICNEFKYLGVVFSKNRSFFKAIKHNVEQAKKAMHLLYKRIRNLHIPVDLQIQLFNHTILPILLYGWGFQNTKMLENVQNQFLRSIGKLRKITQNYMVYAEMGTKPIDTYIKSRMFGYWLTIINSENSKLSKIMYNIMYSESL